jgi:hypothetical protein
MSYHKLEFVQKMGKTSYLKYGFTKFCIPATRASSFTACFVSLPRRLVHTPRVLYPCHAGKFIHRVFCIPATQASSYTTYFVSLQRRQVHTPRILYPRHLGNSILGKKRQSFLVCMLKPQAIHILQ